MNKAGAADFDAMDFLSSQNMTWTNKVPSNPGLGRMGVKSTNAPKAMGSTMVAATGGATTAVVTTTAISSFQSLLLMEGGTPEIPISEQVLIIKNKYSASTAVPKTPLINAFIVTVYIKMLLAGWVNFDNLDLLKI